MSGQGRLIVISGPSGVGKDTLIRRLLELDSNLRKTVSYTTRRPRPGEDEGLDYKFVTPGQIATLIKNGELLEHATYDGNVYGTERVQVDAARAAGHDTIVKIDVQGAEQVRKLFPDALFIFLTPPSMEELAHRQERRNSETAIDMDARRRIAQQELALRTEFDHVVVNDDLERAAREVLSIIRGGRQRQT
jgi:guanylate kinase